MRSWRSRTSGGMSRSSARIPVQSTVWLCMLYVSAVVGQKRASSAEMYM